MKEIKEGSIIEIDGEKYDVFRIWEEWDKIEGDEFIGEHDRCELHKFGEGNVLRSTHILKIYNDGKLVFCKVDRKKGEVIPGMRSRADNVEYSEERDLGWKDINVLK